MKKILSCMLVFAMILSLTLMPASATVCGQGKNNVTVAATDVQPRGAIWGDKEVSIGSGVTSGSFTFEVKGIMDWSTAQVKLTITGFNSNDWVDAKVYRPDGSECFHIAGWLGDVLSTSKRTTNWQTYPNGTRGMYEVRYTVGNWFGNTTGSGTLKCEIK